MKTTRSKSGNRPTLLCLGVCVICALLIVPAQNRLKLSLNNPIPDSDQLYFSSPSLVKKMALGYDNLLADIYWLRTIQYFGSRDRKSMPQEPFKNLATFFDIITSLDPTMTDAYRTGSIFLSELEPVGAGQPEEAVKLLYKGVEANPDIWQLRYDLGLVHYIYLNDFKGAGEVWEEASLRPESPEWMASLAAKAFSEGGAMDTARDLWLKQYEESTNANIKKNAWNRLLSLQVAEDLWTLEFVLGVYRLENGRFPQSLAELPSSKFRKMNTGDPLGTPYDYDPETGAVQLSPESEVYYIEVPASYKENFQLTLVN